MKEQYITLCSIKSCRLASESLKRFGMELCVKHQTQVFEWLYNKRFKEHLK